MDEKKDKKRILIIAIIIIGIFAITAMLIFFKKTTKNDFDTKREDFFIDLRDGEKYKTIKIGDQYWFAENLKVNEQGVKELNYKENKEEWKVAGEEEIPSYSVYANEKENKDIYGYLYNWYAINFLELCPEGWVVPSDEDWHQLEKYLADNENPCQFQRKGSLACSPAGAKMKMKDEEKGTDYWNHGDFNCQENNNYDCSGFNVLPGGSRYTSGTFFGMGSHAYFWSSSGEEGSAWFRNLREKNSGVLRNESSMELGMSVRCLKK